MDRQNLCKQQFINNEGSPIEPTSAQNSGIMATVPLERMVCTAVSAIPQGMKAAASDTFRQFYVFKFPDLPMTLRRCLCDKCPHVPVHGFTYNINGQKDKRGLYATGVLHPLYVNIVISCVDQT